MTQISHTAPDQAAAAHAADATAPTPQPLNVLDKVGMGILGLLTLSGLWMMLAPFLTDTQERGADWSAGTTNDFFVGLVLAVLSLAALVTVLAGGLAAIARRARDRAAAASSTTEA
jgi:cytochrome c biogenesis protein CcdA